MATSCRALMKEKLAAGESIVVDRYSFSGVAFSSAKAPFLFPAPDPQRTVHTTEALRSGVVAGRVWTPNGVGNPK